MNRALRAIGASRVSTKGQGKAGRNSSLARQRRELVQLADKLGFDLVDVFSETATAAKFDSRHFTNITKRVAKGDIDVILFSRVDRFARDVFVGLGHLYNWITTGIRVFIGTEEVDRDNPAKMLVLITTLAAAQFQRDSNAMGAKGRHIYAANEGRWYGNTPLGYILEEYDPEETR